MMALRTVSSEFFKFVYYEFILILNLFYLRSSLQGRNTKIAVVLIQTTAPLPPGTSG